jgi:hypothetical protein
MLVSATIPRNASWLNAYFFTKDAMLGSEREALMGRFLDTTPSIALIERWNRQQQLRYPRLPLVKLYYSPKKLVLIRPLTEAEREHVEGEFGDPNQQIYGVFSARHGDWLACGTDAAILAAQALAQRYVVTWLQ